MLPYTITFYSYKGGVGRTLLAANVGVLRARKGKTLLWDLDIEAPGLHRIPDLAPEGEIRRGLFEWLLDWQQARAADPQAAPDYDALAGCILPSALSDGLHLLPAHAGRANAARLYGEIDWDAFLVRDLPLGFRLLNGALERFAALGYRTVLLDARTGITDLGGLLTAFLPHLLVMVGNYGAQNVGGLAEIHRNLRPAFEGRLKARGDRPPLECLLVASPIPGDFPERSAAQAVWRDAFGIAPKEALVEIPFAREVLFTDRLLAAHGEPGHPARRAYEALDARIQQWHDANLVLSRRLDASRAERPEEYGDEEGGPLGRGPRRAQRFEERVARLLRLLDYEVEEKPLIDGHEVDLTAVKRGDFGQLATWLVECKAYSGALPAEAAERLAALLEGPEAKARGARGMLVAEREFSAAALAHCRAHPERLLALTFPELERSLFDFAPYLARLRHRFESSPLARYYVPQKVRREKRPGEPPADLLPHALGWAAGEGSRLWLLLGDYGTGKSSFVARFAHALAQRCEEDPAAPVPLAVNLRDYPNAIDLETLLADHLRRELDQAVNPERLLYLLAAGRIVLLLDSFDEMGVAQAGRSVEEQFRRLAAPTARDGDHPLANRVFITSRTHFFRDHAAASRAAAGASTGASTGAADPEAASPLGRAARQFDATLDELPPFDHDQIRAYLKKRLGAAEATAAWERIQAIYGLAELAAVPQLLEIILETLPELTKQALPATPGALYHLYTDRWLSDPRCRRREMALSADQVTLLLERLATLLWGREEKRLHYADLARAVREQSPTVAAGLDHERVDLELRTAAFLVRSADGHFRFSHKSFLEFFLARHLWHRLGEAEGLAEALDTAPLNPETLHMLGDLLRADRPEGADGEGGDPYRPALAAVGALLGDCYRPRVSENGLLLRYHLACHALGLKPGETPSGVGGYAALRQRQEVEWPRPARLEGAALAGMELPGILLTGAQLAGADLSGSRLDHAGLSGAGLRGADLEDASLAGATLVGAGLEEARLARCDARGAGLERVRAAGSDWHGARMQGARLTGADLGGARLRMARLVGAELAGVRSEGADWAGATGWGEARTAPEGLGGPWVEGHWDRLTGCAFSPDGRFALTASGDRTARLWEVGSGREVGRFTGHAEEVTGCAFSPDGLLCLTTSGDGTARLWAVADGNEVRRFEGHQAEVTAGAFSPDGRLCLTASRDGTARLWEAGSGREVRRFEGHANWVTACAFSPDGRRCLTASHDQSARLWETATGQEVRRFKGHTGWVTACALSPDGRRCLTASCDDTARLWDVETGKELRRFEGHSLPVAACTFSPDGQRCLTASTDGSACLWEGDTGRELSRLRGHGDWVIGATLSPDGRLCLTASRDGTARLWEAASGRELRRLLPGAGDRLSTAALLPDGLHFLTASWDGTARLWELASGRELRRIEVPESGPITASDLSRDGRRLVTAYADRSLRLWEAATGRELSRLQGHRGDVSAASLSADGHRCLTASHDGRARLWDAESGEELRRFEGHDGPLTACALSPDGRRCLSVQADGIGLLWEAESGVELRRFGNEKGEITACTFSPDGRRYLTAYWDGTARLWKVATGKEVRRFVGHTNRLTACTFSPDGRLCLTASWDYTARLWDIETGKELCRFEGHLGPVTSCSLSADGRRCLTASADRTARLWDAETGACLRIHLPTRHGWAAWSPDGRWIGEGDALEGLYFTDPTDTPPPEGLTRGWLPRLRLAADLPDRRRTPTLSL